ncbi:MAG TPA: homoserine dehydrogenase [Anaerolineaceae bacterium]|nr:homoserine dehydrogenase [Anaerolineaceae bacterium]
MQTYRLALIGFGNVGQGFAQILCEQGPRLEEQFGLRLQIVAIADTLKGNLYDPEGLDPAALLEAVRTSGRVDTVPAAFHGWDALRTIDEAAADVVVELSYTDLKTGEPALTHLRRAIAAGKHVVTSNKGPIALRYPELKTLAREHGVKIGIEGTVMSGTPVLRLAEELLAPAGITRIQGIINGTTNYILTQMESGMSYTDALAEAQEKGYAEADPSGDVDGHDAAGKAAILANLLMGGLLIPADVDRTGISALTSQDVAAAKASGERWKLIARVERVDGQVIASVRPTRLPLSHPLAAVSGAINAITFTTRLLGDVTLVGPGAGRLETGYAIVGDLLAIGGIDILPQN